MFVLAATVLVPAPATAAGATTEVEVLAGEAEEPPQAEFVLSPTSTVTLPTTKPRKQVWWHDGHWWILGDGWYAYRRDGRGDWVRAGTQLVGQNSRRLDVVVDNSDGTLYWYGWRSTTDDHLVGRATYDPATKTYSNAVRYGNREGDPPLPNWGSTSGAATGALDSLGRYWVVGDDPGVTRYMVFDPTDFTILQDLTTLDDQVWGQEHQSRVLAFKDDDGPAIGVVLDDQASREMRFWVRRDSDPLDGGWSQELVEGADADNHGDVVATPEGEVLAVWKTSASREGEPNLMYARRTSSGEWTDHTVVRNRFGPRSIDEYTRPRVQYDSTNDRVFVVAPDRVEHRRTRVFVSSRTAPDFGVDGPPAAVLETEESVENPTVSALHVHEDSGLMAVGRSSTAWWGLHVPVTVADDEPPADPDPPGPDTVLHTTLALRHPIAGTDIGGLQGGQYRWTNTRNFWWNAQQQRWDGFLPTSSPPAGSPSSWWLWHDLGGSPTPIAQADGAASTKPDAYWNEETNTLHAFFSRGSSGNSLSRRFVYDPITDRYTEDSAPGGVPTHNHFRGGATIIRSPNGHLWAGVNYNSRILVSRSTDNGDTWAEPAAIKTTDAHGEGHWVVLDVDGYPHVAFAATEDGDAPGGQPRVHFLHVDQDEPDWANPARWNDETALLPAWEGDERADDELSAVAFEGRVFVVIETEPLGNARSNGDPQLVVFEREADGNWIRHVIRRYTTGPEDAKRPVVTVDAANRLLVVSAGTTRRTHADLWYAPIDSLAGRDGQWSRLRVFEVTDPGTQNIYNTRMPLPRFPVTADSELLLIVDDQGDAKEMWRQVVSATEPADDPPVVESVVIDETEPTTEETLTVSVDARGGGELAYQWIANGIDLDGETGSTLDLSVPGNGDKGDRISVRVTASDGDATSVPVTSAEVTVVNAPPTFVDPLQDQSSREGDEVSLSATATDPDDDPLRYTATGLPPGLAIDDVAGVVSGVITAGAAGDSPYTVTVTVDDGDGGRAHEGFTWNVTAPQPPDPDPPGPAAPTGLHASATSIGVDLRWEESPEPDLAGYRLYRSADEDGPFTAVHSPLITDRSFRDDSAPQGTSYYQLTAVDTAGRESPPVDTAATRTIMFRSAETETARNASSLTLPRPSEVRAGDVLVAAITVDSTPSVDAPGGWTLAQIDASGYPSTQAIYYTVAVTNGESAYTWTFSDRSASVSGVILAYHGVDSENPLDVVGGRSSSGSPSIAAPNLSTTAVDALVVGLFGTANQPSLSISAPADMIGHAEAIQNAGRDKTALKAADTILAEPGDTGSWEATINRSGHNIGQLLVLRPRPGSSP